MKTEILEFVWLMKSARPKSQFATYRRSPIKCFRFYVAMDKARLVIGDPGEVLVGLEFICVDVFAFDRLKNTWFVDPCNPVEWSQLSLDKELYCGIKIGPFSVKTSSLSGVRPRYRPLGPLLSRSFVVDPMSRSESLRVVVFIPGPGVPVEVSSVVGWLSVSVILDGRISVSQRRALPTWQWYRTTFGCENLVATSTSRGAICISCQQVSPPWSHDTAINPMSSLVTTPNPLPMISTISKSLSSLSPLLIVSNCYRDSVSELEICLISSLICMMPCYA